MTASESGPTELLASETNAQASAFFEAAYKTFEQAERSADSRIERSYVIGGYTVRLRFAGSALVPRITPALEHQAGTLDSGPSLTVYLWDSVSTQTQMPAPPWSTGDYVTRGEIHGFDSPHFQTAYFPWFGALSMLNTTSDLAIYWIRDAAEIPHFETGAPVRAILHWWMRDHERMVAHAAAVGTPDGGVLLVGKGGSGKSTTALSCLDSELLYVGDDYVLLGEKATPYVHSLYNTAKLNPDHTQHFPHLLPAISNRDRLDNQKALIFLKDHYPQKIASGFPVKAILIPRITGGPETWIEEASTAAGLAALIPSTLFQQPGAGRQDFERLTAYVKSLPSYYLNLGRDIPAIPSTILNFLD